jgi:hypothetical protein
MSSTKFASITSSLLARKGEAKPWAQEAIFAPSSWHDENRPAISSPPPSPPGKDRSCSVRMSGHDYERLGILAVKNGVTRQKLLKDALAQFLTAKAQDYACACLGACDRNCPSKD